MPHDLRVLMGRRVRQLRDATGLSQEALAERAGLHRNYVGSVERGERDVGLNAVASIAKALVRTFFVLFLGRFGVARARANAND